MSNLPSYINPSQNRGVAQRALANAPIGSPPYLSIEGGRFTLVDAAGNTRQFQTLFADVVIVDVNDHMSKIYFPDAYTPGASTPPLCFSDNGIAPSRQAGEKQSPTCASCHWNEWGSKVSNMGSKVKACTDVQKIAIIIPGIPGQEFLLRIPPNSLKNWGGYLATFRGYDVSDVVTRLSFQEGIQGTLKFEPSPAAFFDNPQWAQCQLLACREHAWNNPGVKAMIGATDQPAEGVVGGPGFRGGQIAGAQTQQSLPAPQQGYTSQPQQGFQPPVEQAAFQPALAPSVGFQPTGTAPQQQIAPPAPGASPSEQQPGRRRRRTQAEIAADNAKAAGAQAQQPGNQLTAPFPHPQQEQPAGAPSFTPAAPANGGPGTTFGITQGVAPDPAMSKMLEDTFGPNFRSPGQ